MIELFKNMFKENYYIIAEGEDFTKQTGLEFIAFKGIRNPYKSTIWTDKVMCGFTIQKNFGETHINIIEELINTGIYDALKNTYQTYHLFNTGVLVYFAETGDLKFLTLDRIDFAIKTGSSILEPEDIFDLDLFFVVYHSRDFDLVRENITVKNREFRRLAEEDKKKSAEKIKKAYERAKTVITRSTEKDNY